MFAKKNPCLLCQDVILTEYNIILSDALKPIIEFICLVIKDCNFEKYPER